MVQPIFEWRWTWIWCYSDWYGAGQRLSLQFVTKNPVYQYLQEGGDYVTKDISKVLKTSQKPAEGLKLNYGETYPPLRKGNVPSRSDQKNLLKSQKITCQRLFLHELTYFEQQDLDRRHLLIFLVALFWLWKPLFYSGIVELAQEVFGVRAETLFQTVGIRGNPAFAHVTIHQNLRQTEVHPLNECQGWWRIIPTTAWLWGNDPETSSACNNQRLFNQPLPQNREPVASTELMQDFQQASQIKPKLADRFRGRKHVWRE